MLQDIREGGHLPDDCDFDELYTEIVNEVVKLIPSKEDWCDIPKSDLLAYVRKQASFIVTPELFDEAYRLVDPPGIKPGTSRLIPPPMNDFNGWSYEMTNGKFGANLDGSGCFGFDPIYYDTRSMAEYEARVEAFTYGIEGSVVEIVSEEKAQEILKEMGYDRPSV